MNSTYKLLVQSEDKRRNLLETALYAIVALSALVSIEQFTMQPNPLPLNLHAATHASVQQSS